MGDTEATSTSRTETTATTEVSQDAALSSIEGSVNCSSSERRTKLVTRAFFPGPKAREKRPGDEVERCTPLSGIGKRLNHGRASEASRATSDILQQHTCRDELKTASALSAIGPSGYTYFTAPMCKLVQHLTCKCHLFSIFCCQSQEEK